MVQEQWISYKGSGGPGSGKSIVFLSGDEEYRSEEGLPMLAKLLSQTHGFNCTVLFSINKKTGATFRSHPFSISALIWLY